MSGLRRSFLQVQILFILEKGNIVINSLATLAQQMRLFRSSISRSMNALKKEGLVRKDNNTWLLTTQGKLEVAELHIKILQEIQESKQIIDKLLGIENPHDINVTDNITWGDIDGESLTITKCVCGANLGYWEFIIHPKYDLPHIGECPKCGRALYYTLKIEVFERKDSP